MSIFAHDEVIPQVRCLHIPERRNICDFRSEKCSFQVSQTQDLFAYVRNTLPALLVRLTIRRTHVKTEWKVLLWPNWSLRVSTKFKFIFPAAMTCRLYSRWRWRSAWSNILTPGSFRSVWRILADSKRFFFKKSFKILQFEEILNKSRQFLSQKSRQNRTWAHALIFQLSESEVYQLFSWYVSIIENDASVRWQSNRWSRLTQSCTQF